MTSLRALWVLGFLWAYHQEHGCMPTLREIAEGRSISAPGARLYLAAFEREGLIWRKAHKARAYSLTSIGRRRARAAWKETS
jgi:DNA-binding MarR family transcriptional regulator